MRIGIALQSLDPTWGGIGIYTEAIVEHLLKIDQRNEYVLIYPGFGNARDRLGMYSRVYGNVVEIETPKPLLTTCTYWDQFTVPGVATKERIHLLFNPFWTTPFLGRFKKVIIIHGVEQDLAKQVYDLKVRIQWLLHDKLLIWSADRIIAISDLMAKDLASLYGVPAARIRRIYHGLDGKFRRVEDTSRLNQIRSEYHLPDDFVLFVGMIYPQKNFTAVLRALHKIAERTAHHLVVAGAPRWRFDEDLALVDRLGLRDRVHFLGFVPNDDLPAIYSLARYFVFPSLYEAFGLAGIEAMACGCPVIAARAGALPEVLGDAAVFFDPLDPGALAEAMLGLENDPTGRDVLIGKGLERARAFSWDRCARETLQLFEELTAG